MGKWLSLGLAFEATVVHMIALGIRRELAETILLVEQGKITGSIVEKQRPAGALDRFYGGEEVTKKSTV